MGFWNQTIIVLRLVIMLKVRMDIRVLFIENFFSWLDCVCAAMLRPLHDLLLTTCGIELVNSYKRLFKTIKVL